MDDRRRESVTDSAAATPAPSRGWWKQLGWLVSLLALGFVLRWLLRVDHSAWRSLTHVNGWWLVASLIIFQGWFLARYWVWEFIIHRHGYEHDRGQNLRMWITSELLRYIPGNVWSFAGRYRGARQGGVERGSTIQALVLEAVGLVAGATVVALLTIHAWWWVAPIIVVAMITVGPQTIRWLFKIAKQESPSISRLESIIIIFGYCTGWIIFGLAHVALFRAMHSTIGSVANLTAISVSVFSWLVGYITIITPMGLGVREAIFSNRLVAQTHIPLATASLAAIVGRIWMVISELVFLGLVMIFSRRRQ